jgi:membrane protease YdiL (CAAX protease family)
MADTVGRRGGAEWLGAIARIIAFIILGGLIALALVAGYGLLPRATGGTAMLLGGSIPAVAALLAGSALIRAFDGRSPAALGIGVSSRTAGLSASGLAIGVVGLAVAAAPLLATGLLTYRPQAGTTGEWVATLAQDGAVFAVAALSEEAVFRGYPFQVLVRSAGAPVAVVVTSFGFAVVHSNNPDVGVLALVNIFLAGIVFALAFLRTLSLWFVTMLHLGWNWAMATLFDLPVSGFQQFDTPLYEPAVTGPAWFTGGEFGPEGGVIGTLGFAVTLVATLRWRVVQPDPGVRAAGPLVLPDEAARA